jgi:GT2 family glycosyltransferase
MRGVPFHTSAQADMSARTAVIILNWNSHQITSDCIRSLLAMGDAGLEILVVENGSSDGSVKMLLREFLQGHRPLPGPALRG